MKLQEAEDDALNQCARLLRFAAEHRTVLQLKELQPTVEAITRSLELREAGNWDANASKDFWMAYSALCDLVRPTTLETIDASAPIQVNGWRRWIFFGSLSQISPYAFARWMVILNGRHNVPNNIQLSSNARRSIGRLTPLKRRSCWPGRMRDF